MKLQYAVSPPVAVVIGRFLLLCMANCKQVRTVKELDVAGSLFPAVVPHSRKTSKTSSHEIKRQGTISLITAIATMMITNFACFPRGIKEMAREKLRRLSLSASRRTTRGISLKRPFYHSSRCRAANFTETPLRYT